MSGTDFPSDPTDPDTDDDGLGDGEEAGDWETDSYDPDTDDDGPHRRRGGAHVLHAPAQT